MQIGIRTRVAQQQSDNLRHVSTRRNMQWCLIVCVTEIAVADL